MGHRLYPCYVSIETQLVRHNLTFHYTLVFFASTPCCWVQAVYNQGRNTLAAGEPRQHQPCSNKTLNQLLRLLFLNTTSFLQANSKANKSYGSCCYSHIAPCSLGLPHIHSGVIPSMAVICSPGSRQLLQKIPEENGISQSLFSLLTMKLCTWRQILHLE